MNPQEALEIMVAMLNRVTLNPAERAGLQVAIRTLEGSLAERAQLIAAAKEKAAEAAKPEEIKSAPTPAEAVEGAGNVQIEATEKAEINA